MDLDNINIVNEFDNENVDNEPAIKFIDNLFAKVEDWKILENDSGKNGMYRKDINPVKNKYDKYDIEDIPVIIKCNNRDIKITITLERYIWIIFPTIIVIDIDTLKLIKIVMKPALIGINVMDAVYEHVFKSKIAI